MSISVIWQVQVNFIKKGSFVLIKWALSRVVYCSLVDKIMHEKYSWWRKLIYILTSILHIQISLFICIKNRITKGTCHLYIGAVCSPPAYALMLLWVWWYCRLCLNQNKFSVTTWKQKIDNGHWNLTFSQFNVPNAWIGYKLTC